MEPFLKKIFICITFLLVTGCTSINVKQLDPSINVSHICIEENPKVIVSDFLPVVQKGFKRHGITTEVYKNKIPSNCEYNLTYTALKTWDMAMYLHHAELWLYHNKENIAYAEYHLNGKGGLALNKWASVDSKMNPVINQLLSGYPTGTRNSPKIISSYQKASSNKLSPLHLEGNATEAKLRKLKKWLDDELITKEEYKLEKQKVLAAQI